jgi:hypothetical protein
VRLLPEEYLDHAALVDDPPVVPAVLDHLDHG